MYSRLSSTIYVTVGMATNASFHNDSSMDPEFSCSLDNLNRTAVTDPSYWRILSSLEDVRFLIAAVEIVFCVIAFVLNLFIIITMLVKYRMLREPANIYLLNLAVVDFLLTVTVVIPFTIVTEVIGEFAFGSSDYTRCAVCDLSGVLLIVFNAASLHTIAALSFDRFLVFANPLTYKRHMTWPKAVLVVVLIWFISFWIGFPPILGFGQFTFNQAFANCHPEWTGDNFNYVRYVLFEQFIPIAILLLTNVWTYRFISKYLKKRLVRRTIIRKSEGQEKLNEEKRLYRKKQRYLVRTFTALLIVYVITWTPTIIIAVIANFVRMADILEFAVFGWICYITNPVVHPIIETFFVKELREEVSKAKKCICKRIRCHTMCKEPSGQTIVADGQVCTYAVGAISEELMSTSHSRIEVHLQAHDSDSSSSIVHDELKGTLL